MRILNEDSGKLQADEESKMVSLLSELSCRLGVLEAARLITKCPCLYDAKRPQWQQCKSQLANQLCESLGSDTADAPLLESSFLVRGTKLTPPARSYLEDVARQSFSPDHYWRDPHHGRVLKNIVERYASDPSEILEVLARQAVLCIPKLIEPGGNLNIERPLVELITRIWKTDAKLKETFGDTMKKSVFPLLGSFWQRVQDKEISRENLRNMLREVEAAVELLYMGGEEARQITGCSCCRHVQGPCRRRTEGASSEGFAFAGGGMVRGVGAKGVLCHGGQLVRNAARWLCSPRRGR